MGNMIGADVEALQRLALQFEQSADRLRAQAGQVANGVSVSAWAGPVAVRFRTDWDSTHSVALKSAAEALSASAKDLRQNAAEQSAASASLAGGAGSAVLARSMRIDELFRNATLPGFVPPGMVLPDWRMPFDFYDKLRDVEIGGVSPIDIAKLAAGGASFAGDVAGGVVSKVFNVADVATDVANGDWVGAGLGAVSSAGDFIQERFPTPVGYLAGANVKLWSMVVDEGRKIDWGYVPETFDYMVKHPGEAFSAGVEDTVKALPRIAGALIPPFLKGH